MTLRGGLALGLTALAAGALAFFAGRWTSPACVEKEAETKVVIQEVVAYDHSKFLVWDFNKTTKTAKKVDTHRETTTKTTKLPDGTETTETKTVEDTHEREGSNTKEQNGGAAGEEEKVRIEKQVEYVDRVVKTDKPRYSLEVSAEWLAKDLFDRQFIPTLGAAFDYRFVGPVWVGVGANLEGEVNVHAKVEH